MQETAFLTEGDAYHLRNGDMQPDLLDQYLDTLPLTGKNILDIGAQNGRRLARLDGFGYGVEPSKLAIDDGAVKYPHIDLQRGLSHELPFDDEFFDLVIISFVFHWVGRKNLLKTISEIDRVLKPGGLLVIADFYPPEPKAVPYHHKNGLVTYKQFYWEPFETSRRYTVIKKIRFIHEATIEEPTLTGGDDQAIIVSLQKSGI